MKKIKIGKMGLFATPDSVDVIIDWIERHPADQKASLYTAMGMTWNLLSELVDESGESNDSNTNNDD